jgi:hypothetical protein
MKTLLGVSSFFLPLALAGLSGRDPRWFVFLPLIPLAASLWLLLAYLEVGITSS